MEQRQHGNPIKSAGEVNLQEEGYARFNPPSRGDGAGVSVTGEVASEKRETQSFSEASGAHQQWCVHMSALSLNADHRIMASLKDAWVNASVRKHNGRKRRPPKQVATATYIHQASASMGFLRENS